MCRLAWWLVAYMRVGRKRKRKNVGFDVLGWGALSRKRARCFEGCNWKFYPSLLGGKGKDVIYMLVYSGKADSRGEEFFFFKKRRKEKEKKRGGRGCVFNVLKNERMNEHNTDNKSPFIAVFKEYNSYRRRVWRLRWHTRFFFCRFHTGKRGGGRDSSTRYSSSSSSWERASSVRLFLLALLLLRFGGCGGRGVTNRKTDLKAKLSPKKNTNSVVVIFRLVTNCHGGKAEARLGLSNQTPPDRGLW